MNGRKLFFRAGVCLGLVGCLFLTVHLFCGPKSTRFYAHNDEIEAIVISPDGRTMASGSYDKTVKIWDVASGRERTTLKGHAESVLSVAFSQDGKILASGSSDNTVKLWDVATGQERAILRGHAGKFICVAFSPDGKTLATVGTSETVIQLWDLATGRVWATLQGHTGGITSVAFSRDGKTLATGSWDCTTRLWDTATGLERAILRVSPKASTNSVAFSQDGKTLACGNADRRVDSSEVMLWDLATGQESKRLTIPKCIDESYLYYLTFSPDDKALAAIETFTAIHLWDIASGKNTANFDWYDEDKKPFGTFVDNVLERLPAISYRHEYVHWMYVYFNPHAKLVALARERLNDSPIKSRYTAKLLELTAIPNAEK